MYVVQISSKAVKLLKNLPQDYRNMIKQRIISLQDNPNPRGSITLVGSDSCFRIRIGPFRVQYKVLETEKLILVYKISRRSETTYS